MLAPAETSGPAKVEGLLREHGTGAFLANGNETFEALFVADTVRAPEWSVSGGDLRPNGQTVHWRLPEAGRHTISLTLFLVDGSTARARWTVDVQPREAAHP